MNYFGPHAHSVIDFRKLEEAPIFLIGGDTGAGKSTIFDAMTFALFGSTTNDGPEGRNAKDMRSQFAPDDKATSVTFYFEQGNNLYRIVRTPDQFLTKKRGKGLTKNNATAKLSIVNEVDGVEKASIAAKPADVGTEIAGILNLTVDQFKKIILLPQNDFSEFLKSKTSDKEDILKKIFGTQLYSDFTKQLKAKYDEANEQGKQFDSDLNNQFTSTNWTDDEKEQIKHEAPDQRVVLLKAFVNDRQKDVQTAAAISTKLDQTVKQTSDQLEKAKAVQNQFDDLNKFKTDYQTKITNQKATIDQDLEHVTELQWADPLKDTVRDLGRQSKELRQTQVNQTSLAAQVDQAKKTYQSALTKFEQLQNQADDFTAKDKRLQELTTLIPTVVRVEQLRLTLKKLQPQVDKIQATLTEQTAQANQITADIKTKTATLQPIDQLQSNKDALTKEKADFIDTLTPLENNQLNLAKEVAKIQQDFDKLSAALQTKQDHEKSAHTVFDQKISERQKWMIAQLQTELQDDQPCIVCGSTDHSHMVPVAENASEAELKSSMKAVDAAQDAYASAKKDTETTQKRVDETTAKLTAKTEEAQAAAKALADKYTELVATSELDFPATFSMAAIRKQFDQQLKEIETSLTAANKLAKEIQKLEEQSQQANEQISASKLQLATKETQINSTQKDLAEASKDITTDVSSQDLQTEKKALETASANYQKQFKAAQQLAQDSQLSLSKNQTKLEDADNHLKEQQTQLNKLTETLKQALQAPDAKTTEQTVLETWINELNQNLLSQLQVTISNYQQEKTRLETEIKQLETKLTDIEKPDVAGIQQLLNEQQAKKEAAIANLAHTKDNFDAANGSYEIVQKIMQKQGDFTKKLSEITGLYNIVTGKDGNDSKLKLETYVVQNYLQRVLNYANDHFIGLLSNNRYTFELADEGADKRKDHGLDINVFDNETGHSRPSGTLSGGETFIAALSIALSLSEVVQSSSNGVQIDALFVDEGFGSLDDETLTKAMEALENIGKNRIVGVISHIDSMKQTIGQQLLVKKMGDGRSSIELISK